MTVTAPETTARLKLKQLLDAEFAPEGFATDNDRLHGSIGWKGTRIATSPVRSSPKANDFNVMRMELLVQFYGKWSKEVNPEQKVDPEVIEVFAERFRRALRTGDPNTSSVWFFRLLSISYPPDPTGNLTRFEAQVEAVANNPALLETTG